MTNTERQRQFRESHPDYYRLLHAKRRASKETPADRAIARAEAWAARLAQIRRPAVSIPSLLDRVRAQPLMLPAPAEELIFPALQEREHALLKSSQT